MTTTINEGQKLYTVAQTANVLGVSVTTVRKLMDEGKLESLKIGRARRIKSESVERLVAEGD